MKKRKNAKTWKNVKSANYQKSTFPKTQKSKKWKNTKIDISRKRKKSKKRKHENRHFCQKRKSPKSVNYRKSTFLTKTQKDQKVVLKNGSKIDIFRGGSKNTKKVQKVTFLGFSLYLYIPPLNYLRAVASIFHEN